MSRSIRWLTVILFSPAALALILLLALMAATTVVLVGLKSYADLTRSPKSAPEH